MKSLFTIGVLAVSLAAWSGSALADDTVLPDLPNDKWSYADPVTVETTDTQAGVQAGKSHVTHTITTTTETTTYAALNPQDKVNDEHSVVVEEVTVSKVKEGNNPPGKNR